MEIIVVDDQSEDETPLIVEEYARRDSRIRLFVNEVNLGLAPNWNRCVELSTGEWIKFVLQDDLIESECIEKMIDDCSGFRPLCVCRRRFLFEKVGVEVETLYHRFGSAWSMGSIFPGRREIPAKLLCDAVRKHGAVNFIGEPTAVLIHRDMFHQFGGFNPNFVQLCDLEYWLRVGVQTGLSYIPETLATFRVHHGSMTSKGLSSAYFRTQVIDPLLLMYEFAYAPLFKPLRKGGLGYHALRIHQRLAEAAYDARSSAARALEDCQTSDSSSLAEWNRLVQQYPQLDRLFYSRLIKHRENFIRYLWRFRQRKVRTKITT